MGEEVTSSGDPLRKLGNRGNSPFAHKHTMDNPKTKSVASQAKTTAQVTPLGTTNGDIVALAKPFRYTASGDELTVVARNIPYTDGKRGDANQHYARVELSTDNVDVVKLFENVTDEKFEGSAVFTICEEDHRNIIDAIHNNEIESAILTVGLRLRDNADEDSDIMTSVNFKKAFTFDSNVARKKYEAQIKFYASPKIDAVLSSQLLSELQNTGF